MKHQDGSRREGSRLVLVMAAVAACLTSCAPQTGARAPPAVQPALSRADLNGALSVLAEAPAQGFAPGAFGDPARISALLRSSDPDRQAEGGAALRRSLIAYARAEHGLGLPRAQFPKEWGIRPAPYDAAAELDQAIAQHRLDDWLEGLPPPAPQYRALVGLLSVWRQAAARGGWASIPDGPALRRGAHGPLSNQVLVTTYEREWGKVLP